MGYAVGKGSKKINDMVRRELLYVVIGNEAIFTNRTLKSLGTQLNADGGAGEAVSDIVKQAGISFAKLQRRVWGSALLSKHYKVRLWASLIRYFLVYGMESVILTCRQTSKMETCQMNCFKRITGNKNVYLRVSEGRDMTDPSQRQLLWTPADLRALFDLSRHRKSFAPQTFQLVEEQFGEFGHFGSHSMAWRRR